MMQMSAASYNDYKPLDRAEQESVRSVRLNE
jgi:hypothetical protein